MKRLHQQLRTGDDLAVNGPLGSQRRAIALLLLDFSRYHEALSRLNQSAELDVACLVEQDHGMGKRLGLADEPHPRLVHAFQHQHAGHEIQLGKVIFQVSFVAGQMLDGFDAPARLEIGNSVDESKSHGGIVRGFSGVFAERGPIRLVLRKPCLPFPSSNIILARDVQ